MKKLKHTEEMFIAEYIKNGGNGKEAYMTVRPKASKETAKVNACRMLKRPGVQRALQDVRGERLEEAIASQEYLIHEAHEIGQEARQDKSYGAALKGVELKAKLNHVFEDSKESDLMQWYQSIQRLGLKLINEKEVIDITPEREDSESEELPDL
jgi:phage terminase small subunit